MKIGEIMFSDREITLNQGKKTVTILVANKGDRPVQVGSHYHFLKRTSAYPLTVKQPTAIIWIFPPVPLSALNLERKRKCSWWKWEDGKEYLA